MAGLSRSHRVTLAQVSFVILVVVVPLAFGIGWAEHRANVQFQEALASNDVAQCERGNRVRAWIRWDVRLNAGAPLVRTATADRLFPILDCAATQDANANVALKPEDQIAFIEATVGELPPLPQKE